MSIASSNNHMLRPDFTDLLTNHASLAGWLSNALYAGKGVRAEKLLPGFLAECASLGISENAYPFTAEDRGLADIHAYLQNAWSEIEAFALYPTPRRADLDASLASQRETDEHIVLDGVPIDKTPVPESAADNSSKNASAETDDVREKDASAKAGVAEAQAEIKVEEDIAEIATAHMPAAGDLETGEKSAGSQEGTIAGEDIADIETRHMPAAGESEASAQDGIMRKDEDAEEDIADLATGHIPAAEATRGGIEAKREEKETEEIDAAKDVEDIAKLATAHVAAVSSAEDATVGGEDGKAQKPAPQAAPPGSQNSSWRGSKRVRRPRTRRQRVISWVLLTVVLLAILVPVGFLVSFGVNAYTTYRSLSDQAHSAVNHLLDVKNDFSGGNSRLNSILDSAKLQKAQQDFVASGHDFQQLQQQLQQSSSLRTITTYFPQYRETLASAQAASQVGVDVARIGQIATSQAAQVAPSFKGPLLAPGGKPLITQSLLNTITTTIDQITPLLNDIQARSQSISLSSLPISATEKAQVGQALQALPQVITDIGIVRGMLGDAGWLLGVDHPRTFLVQTMDRAELRGAGGFTGQYGELTVNGGRVEPFSLKDISLVEYTDNSVTQGQMAPDQYRSWWPFANWGLRDSNVSADFPTTAQLAINLYKQETGDKVDGVITFTPVVIEHVLSVIGPIQVPGYNTTVTAQNLEDLLHYYQLDNRGILKQILKQPDNTSTSQRKRFTNYLATLVMGKVRSAPPEQLLAIAHQVLSDLKSKELQMYFTDPATESILTKYGYAGQMDRSTTHDGLYVVQENLSASKASQYVRTIMQDTVTLDSKGGATHQLQIRLVYNQAGPVYGYDTYYDYLRVYVPPNSKLLSGDGFSTGTPLCGGIYGDCPVDGVYAGGELTCPEGQYQPGAAPPSLTDSDGGRWRPLQTIGGPTNTTSDEAGRAMFGGWVIVPKNCTMNVSLSWYVPPLSNQPYSLLVQRQAGTFPELDLSVLPDAADCAKLGTAGLHFDNLLLQDTRFTVPAYHPQAAGQQSCYPGSGV